MDELLRDFLTETSEHLSEVEAQLVQFERTPADASLIGSIFRLMHTIKGTSGFLGLDRLQAIGHAAETLLGRMRDGEPPTAASVSLVLASIDRIRAILATIETTGAEPLEGGEDLVGAIDAYLAGHREDTPAATAAHTQAQQVVDPDPGVEAAPSAAATASPSVEKITPARGPADQKVGPARTTNRSQNGETIRVTVATLETIMQLVSELVLARNQLLELTRNTENDGLKVSLQRLSGLTADLQDAVMRARMQPVSLLFSNLPRMVRELSLDLSKKINIVTEGGETELDRQLIEVIRDPLTHIIRNCTDHGIEAPDERAAQGKPTEGEIRVRASQEAGQFVIEITDDGRGVNIERVKAKAISAGLVREAELARLSHEEICRFIFEPGFSTASNVTNVSGRGVGMDVVRTNVEAVRGTVALSSTEGVGTRLTLRIPLTLAIAPALIVEVAGQRFALPQHSVIEVVEANWSSDGNVKSVQGSLVVDLRGDIMPAARLPQLLTMAPASPQAVDAKLIAVLRSSSGSIGLLLDAVIDVQEIVVKPLSRSLSHLDVYSGHTILGDGSVLLILDPSGIARKLGISSASRAHSHKFAAVTRQAASRLVLFRAGSPVHKVLPASIVSRIEEVEPGRLKRSEVGLVMPFQDILIPVLELAEGRDASDATVPVIIVTMRGRTFGLMVDRIVDIVEDAVGIEIAGEHTTALGTGRVRGEVVDVVDPLRYAELAYPHRDTDRPGAPANVLLLAGDPQSIDLVAPFIEAAGHRVATARSFEAARSLGSGDAKIDVILVDLATAAADYRELVDSADWVRAVPVIGLQGNSGRLDSKDHGALEFRNIANMFDRPRLLDALSVSLSSAA